MAVSVASWAQSVWNTAVNKTITGVSWTSGDVVVVVGGTASDTTTLATPTNANLTFALQASETTGVGNTECCAYVWTAVAVSTQSAQSIVSTGAGGSEFRGIAVWVFTPTAGETLGVGVSAAGKVESSLSLTVSAGSAVVYGGFDWNASAAGKTGSTGSGTLTEQSDQNASNYTLWIGDWVTTSSGTFGFGVSSYSGWVVAQVAVEVTASGDAAAAIPEPSWSYRSSILRR